MTDFLPWWLGWIITGLLVACGIVIPALLVVVLGIIDLWKGVKSRSTTSSVQGRRAIRRETKRKP